MKTNLTILAIGFLLSFCTPKTEVAPVVVDDRDKFIGSYKGTATVTLPSGTETNSFSFSMAKDANGLKIGTDLTGTAKGNTITTNQVTVSKTLSNGTLMTLILDSGILTLNGNSLTGTMPIIAIANNQTFKGTYKIDTAKQ